MDWIEIVKKTRLISLYPSIEDLDNETTKFKISSTPQRIRSIYIAKLDGSDTMKVNLFNRLFRGAKIREIMSGEHIITFSFMDKTFSVWEEEGLDDKLMSLVQEQYNEVPDKVALSKFATGLYVIGYNKAINELTFYGVRKNV